MSESEVPRARRPVPRGPDGGPQVRRLGVPQDGWRDVYYFLLDQRWSVFYLLLISGYLAVNCGFATLYWLKPGSIAEEHPGLWSEDFFFSVETLATVGYGAMHPITVYSHWVAVAEIILGMLAVPFATGITILKFARPHARVVFSRNVLIADYDGVPTLMFRAANMRDSQIYETRMNVTLLRFETSPEGRVMRRLVDLKLVRDNNPMFVLTWLVMHRIDEHSPLFGIDHATIAASDFEVMTIMTGLDATTSATVHARNVYQMADLLIGHYFVDIITDNPPGVFSIDYGKLHDTRAAVEA